MSITFGPPKAFPEWFVDQAGDVGVVKSDAYFNVSGMLKVTKFFVAEMPIKHTLGVPFNPLESFAIECLASAFLFDNMAQAFERYEAYVARVSDEEKS